INAAATTMDTNFYKTTTIPFRARLPRVNKEFSTVENQLFDSIVIRYPIETSLISHAESINSEEELPFAIALKNISTLPLGKDSKTGRPITVELELHPGNYGDLYVRMKDNNQIFNLSQPLKQDFNIPA